MTKIFQDKVVVVTGGARGIGACIAEEFRKCGAHVAIIDFFAPTRLASSPGRISASTAA